MEDFLNCVPETSCRAVVDNRNCAFAEAFINSTGTTLVQPIIFHTQRLVWRPCERPFIRASGDYQNEHYNFFSIQKFQHQARGGRHYLQCAHSRPIPLPFLAISLKDQRPCLWLCVCLNFAITMFWLCSLSWCMPNRQFLNQSCK